MKLLRAASIFALGGIAGFLLLRAAVSDRDRIKVVDAGIRTKTSTARVASGTIRNDSDSPYSHVRVELILFDENGRHSGNTAANRRDLAPGETWTFEVPISARTAEQSQVTEVLLPIPFRRSP